MTHVPLRMCISCRQMKPLAELIRIVSDGEMKKIVLDMQKKHFGRGAYICRNAQCLQRVKKKNLIRHHLKYEPEEGFFEKAEELI